jgi:2-polyprenyl-3-methyl-5-hydroxy-6-metoxy-1,4-benzoquinol methylase
MSARRLDRFVLSTVVFANAKAKRLAIRLTKWTGKSREYVHPKHLLDDTQEHYWYLGYVASGAALLDVGCGNGMHTLKAARRCARVAGVDADLASLGVGLRTSRRLDMTNVGFVAGNVEEGLPVGDGRFDTVLCLDLLEHVYKRDLVLTEIRRVLRPSGILLLAVPNRATAWKRRLERAGLPAYSDPDHKIEYTLDELRDELGRNGFTIRRLHPSVCDMPLVGLIDIVGGLSLPLYRRLTRLRVRRARRYPEENAGFFAVCVAR